MRTRTLTEADLEAIGDVFEKKLRSLARAERSLIRKVDQMDAAGEALTNEINQLDADTQADNAAVVAVGEAVAQAGAKFGELKETIEGLKNSGALSDDEATALLSKASEIDGHLGTATSELTAHVQELGADTAGA